MPDERSIDFWFDANCPFTWRTARWAKASAPARSSGIRWRLMSLYKLNEGKEIPAEYRDRVQSGRRAQRVLAASEAKGGQAALEAVYFAIGRRLHDEGRPIDAVLLEESLAEARLPADLVAASEDEAWDEVIYRSHGEGQDAMGEDCGSPVLSFGGGQAFFGPVLTHVPSAEDGLKLLEALVAASEVSAFTEVKRSRSGRRRD